MDIILKLKYFIYLKIYKKELYILVPSFYIFLTIIITNLLIIILYKWCYKMLFINAK